MWPYERKNKHFPANRKHKAKEGGDPEWSPPLFCFFFFI
jgi:hypothetical protein